MTFGTASFSSFHENLYPLAVFIVEDVDHLPRVTGADKAHQFRHIEGRLSRARSARPSLSRQRPHLWADGH